MSTLFGSTGTGLFGNTNTNTQVAQSGLNAVGGNNENPMKDFLVNQPPDDTLTALRFSPASVSSTFLTSTSWDNRVRCWEINQIAGTANPKAEQVIFTLLHFLLSVFNIESKLFLSYKHMNQNIYFVQEPDRSIISQFV